MVDLLVLQTALNAIDAACVYILVALGFGLIYSTTRFFHFAHGAVVAWAAYFCYGLQKHFDLGFLSASIGAICLATCLGCMIEVAVYGPLRRRDVTPLVLMLASLGIYTVLQNILSLVFGDDLKGLRLAGSRDSISVWGQATLTIAQMIVIGTATILTAATALLLKHSKLGISLRAVASDSTLALFSGIDRERYILYAFGLGSALAAVAGILTALDTNMIPTMGMKPLMVGVVVVIVGGIGSVAGSACAAVLLAIAQNFGILMVGSQWQDAIASMVLLVFLLLRPTGIFGVPLKTTAA